MQAAWVAAAFLAGCLQAQTTGAINGIVIDPSSAAVKGAAVRLTEVQTGAIRNLSSGAEGYFVAVGLAPGSYDIRVSAPGFQSVTRRGVNLDAGRSLRVDIPLPLGEQSQSIVVEGVAPLLSVNAEWGTSVAAERVENLPVNGRDLFELAAREPGAAVSATAQRSQYYGTALHMSVNGARTSQNSYRIDGIYVNDAAGAAPASAAGQTLGIEAVRELRLVASPFLAEYGRAAGAMFVAVSKSGSNDFHGSAYEFLRNSALDARNFFDAAGSPIPPLKRNQFGALASGPIAHNRLFFMGNYEGVRSVSSRTSIATTLGAAARDGRLPGGDVAVAPAVVPYLKIYPLPNGPAFSDGTGQFITPLATPGHENYGTGKADYYRSQRLRFDARYTFDRGGNSTPDPFLIWNFLNLSQYHVAHIGAEYVQSPATLHEFHAGFSRIANIYSYSEISRGTSGLSFAPGQGLGAMAVTGLTDVGSNAFRSLPLSHVTNDYQLNWNVTHVAGAHTLKAGGGFDRVQYNEDLQQDTRGFYQFSSIASLLAAAPVTGALLAPGTSTIRGWRQNAFFAFVQDEFRISRRLQVTAGLRYEPYSTPAEVNGQVAALPDPLHDTSITTGVGLYRNPSRRNFGPRAAMAWDAFGNGRTVFRAGAGLFYDILGTRDLLFAGERMPPFFVRTQVTRPPFPNLSAAVVAGGGGQVVDGLQYYENQPSALQLQALVEHQFGGDLLLRIGYAGSRGYHLPGYVGAVNIAQPAVLPGGQLFFSPTAPLRNPNFQRIGQRMTEFPSNYNALQAHAARRLAHGVRVQANYVWGKVLDEMSNPGNHDYLNDDAMPFPLNFRMNRGPASFDLRQVFSADGAWETRRLSGWQFHGIVQAQSGIPFNPLTGFDRTGLRDGTGNFLGQRTNFVPVPGAHVITGDPAQWFDPSFFVLQPAGTYGNLGRNTLAGPGLINLDVAVHKRLWAHEGAQISLRVEMFNALNHPNFQVPSGMNLFGSNGQRVASAGQITQTTTSSRQLQMALRATF